MKDLGAFYDSEFYDDQMAGSYRSAKLYLECLSRVYLPESVADVGCGRGTWLKAFKEIGASGLAGFDGLWNSQEKMIESSIVFTACDLNKPIINKNKFDLAMSLEVAEHLEPLSATTFVNSLVNLSDVVLFGAAFTEQGGTNHINEQHNSYWASLFASHNVVPFDLFRPIFWGDNRVEFCYQQNTFLYVRKDSIAYATIISKGMLPMTNTEFMNCLHPAIYLNRKQGIPSFRQSMKMTMKALALAIKRRIKPTANLTMK